MKNKSIIIIISTILILTIIGIVFWFFLKKKEVQNLLSRNKIENNIVIEKDQQQNKEEKKEFVIDVDLNMDNWQTKETEFFKIKFPKEWYWLESDREKTGYRSHVITNNPDFDMVKFADIGVGTGGSYPLNLVNNTELVISFNGVATSDAGTPQQSIESKFRGTRERYAQAICEYSSDLKNMPIVANCIFVDANNHKVQTYFIADQKNTILFSIRITEDNLVQKEIFDKMAKSMILQ